MSNADETSLKMQGSYQLSNHLNYRIINITEIKKRMTCWPLCVFFFRNGSTTLVNVFSEVTTSLWYVWYIQ